MNKSIFNLINAKLIQMPQIKYFGLFRNQFNNSLNDREIPYPAVLLQIQPITFNQQLMYNQDAIVNITLHVGMQIVNNVERGDKMLDNSLEILELMDDLYDLIDGISSSDCDISGSTESHIKIGQLSRSSQSISQFNKSIWLGTVNYSFSITIAHKTGLLTSKVVTGIPITTSGYTFL